MPWLSALALLLYLSLLCSPPAPVVAAPSLLTAEQHAQEANAPAGISLFQQEQEGSDDPEQGLPIGNGGQPWPWLVQRQRFTTPLIRPHFLTERQARGPPTISPARHRDQLV